MRGWFKVEGGGGIVQGKRREGEEHVSRFCTVFKKEKTNELSEYVHDCQPEALSDTPIKSRHANMLGVSYWYLVILMPTQHASDDKTETSESRSDE